MSNTPNETPTTVQDVLDNLDDFLTKMRALPLENDFHVGYAGALDDVEHRLLDASPEECRCTRSALRDPSPNTPDQMLKIVQDAVAYMSEAFQKLTSCALETEFEFGYDAALNDLAYQVSAGSQLPPNAWDANRVMANRRNRRCEMIEKVIQQLAAQGKVYDTGERRWSERTQSYQVVWAAVPPKHEHTALVIRDEQIATIGAADVTAHSH
jgi:hypothetical protein